MTQTSNAAASSGSVRLRARQPSIPKLLARYNKLRQAPIRALAARDPRLADLAASFPALLFALAHPVDREAADRAIAAAINGEPLSDVAALARVPIWLRRLPHEAFLGPLAGVPNSARFAHCVVNHLPAHPKEAAVWLKAVCEAAAIGDDDIAVWVARDLACDAKDVNLGMLRLVCLWAWFSKRPDTMARAYMTKFWAPNMRYSKADSAATAWAEKLRHQNQMTVRNTWLTPGTFGGYDFVPVLNTIELNAEANAMDNCLASYAEQIANGVFRIWSIRKDGARVACLSLRHDQSAPFPVIESVLSRSNATVAPDVRFAVEDWWRSHDHRAINTVETAVAARDDALSWQQVCKPYWLAKRRIPHWLPLNNGWNALDRLRDGWID